MRVYHVQTVRSEYLVQVDHSRVWIRRLPHKEIYELIWMSRGKLGHLPSIMDADKIHLELQKWVSIIPSKKRNTIYFMDVNAAEKYRKDIETAERIVVKFVQKYISISSPIQRIEKVKHPRDIRILEAA